MSDEIQAPVVPDFLPYHKQLADLLETEEDGLWTWFASDNMAEQAFEDHRLMLLKNTVRLDQDTYGALYAQAQSVAEKLAIEAPITLFQGQRDQRNAALVFIPGEVNIIFEGDMMEFLSEDELTSVLAHEMAHYLHNTREEGRYFITDRLIDWVCGEPGAHVAHGASFRLSRLYQEIFADRVGLSVCQNRDAAISSLVKVTSGLSKVSVDAYLQQARETVELNDSKGADGYSHPETYIRAIALDDWADDPGSADEKLSALVQGPAQLERLDLLTQRDMSEKTRALIDTFLTLDDEWGASEMLEAHARSFFPDYERRPKAEKTDADPLDLAGLDDTMKDYFAYILADLATVDSELEDTPLLAAFDLSARIGLADAFDKIAAADLKLKVKKVKEIRAERSEAGQ